MIKKKAFAKLNLNLHLLPEKNNNGYYPVHFINTQLTLYDELLFEPLQNKIEVVCDNRGILKQEENLVYKAALMLQEMGSQERGVKITINKNIPVKVGLGGGSSDAAVTIRTLSKLWDINLSAKKLTYLADVLGKDIHYSLIGGVAEISGDGDKVTLLPLDTPKFWVVIITPEDTKPSTGWMYQKLSKEEIGQHVYFVSKVKKAMEMKNEKDFLENLFNDFESSALKYFPAVNLMKQDLRDSGALATLFCGSGLSMVGLFANKDKAIQARDLLTNKHKNAIISQLK